MYLLYKFNNIYIFDIKYNISYIIYLLYKWYSNIYIFDIIYLSYDIYLYLYIIHK